MIDKELLSILVCPVCKETVGLKGEKIICAKCAKAYPVKCDVPVMLIDEAEDIK